jgi:hypothetical protein
MIETSSFGSFGALSDSQQARLDEVTADLDERGKAATTAAAMLRNMEASWRADRYATIYAAALALDGGVMPLDLVLQALDISVATWYRRRAELREALAGGSQPAARSAGDQASTAARHLGPDSEGNL